METPSDGRQWATNNEQVFLEGELPEYVEAQKNNKKYHKYWPVLFRKYFAGFPIRAITAVDIAADAARMAGPPPALPADNDYSDAPLDSPEEEAFAKTMLGKRKRKSGKRKMSKAAKAMKEFEDSKQLTPEVRIKQLLIRCRQEQLKSWMRRHSPAVPNLPRAKKGQTSSLGFNIFDPPTLEKPGRAQQVTEAYIDLYLPTRIRPAVQELARERNHEGPQINLVREVARKLYSNEDEETRAAVAAHLAAQEQARVKEEDAFARAQTAVEPTPADYQLAIDIFPTWADTMLREAVRRTGFCATLILGGPVPNHKGNISTLTYHAGKNEFGSTFGIAHPNFDQDVIRPFIDFLRTVYSPEARSARSLDATSSPQQLEIIGPETCPNSPRSNSPLPGPDKSIVVASPALSPASSARTPDPLPALISPVTNEPAALTPAPAPTPTPVSCTAPVSDGLLTSTPASAPTPAPTPSIAPVSSPRILSPSPLAMPDLSAPTAPPIGETIPPRAALTAAKPSPRLNRIAQKMPMPVVPRPKPRPSVKGALRKRAEEEALSKAAAATAPVPMSSSTAPSVIAAAHLLAPVCAMPAVDLYPSSTADAISIPEVVVPSNFPFAGATPEANAQAPATTDDCRPRRQITMTPLAVEAQRVKEAKEAAAAAAAAKKAAKRAGQPPASRGRGGGQRGARGGARGNKSGSKSAT
ncbi:hypothetical protein HWV62_13795 [Athelia sp. TMB]|nr:hypothetical protein HWV62_13795 [Athelia sp. TMB]